MPRLALTAGQLTVQRSQLANAVGKPPSGSWSSVVTQIVSGDQYLAESGCCKSEAPVVIVASPYKLALITPGQSYDPTFTPVLSCQLFQWPSGIPPTQSVMVKNYTPSSYQYFIGNGNAIPIALLSYGASIASGDTQTIPPNYSGGQNAFYFTDGIQCVPS